MVLSSSLRRGVQDGVTISIVSHGHGALLRQLLRDLNSLKDVHGPKIVLTLNAPGEEVDLSEFRNLSFEIIRNVTPKGFGGNHNQAFAHCKTDWFAVVNPDVRISGDPFVSLLRVGESSPQVAVVAPVVVDACGRLEDSVRRNLTPLSLFKRLWDRRSESEPAQRAGPREFRWYAGMFLMFRAEAFRTIGGFDERFFLYCEDYDICARMHLAGFLLCLDRGTCVVHDARRTSRRSFRYLTWHVKSLMRVWISRPVWQIAMRLRSGEYKQK
jgi:N-acetylglucosaminyl-diphospho-decaprenol L-rhamnosyltransferase